MQWKRQQYTAKKIRFMYSSKKKLRGLSPNFYIYISVSNLYIPRIPGPPTFLQLERQTDGVNI
jgi:hypothetical protein